MGADRGPIEDSNDLYISIFYALVWQPRSGYASKYTFTATWATAGGHKHISAPAELEAQQPTCILTVIQVQCSSLNRLGCLTLGLVAAVNHYW